MRLPPDVSPLGGGDPRDMEVIEVGEGVREGPLLEAVGRDDLDRTRVTLEPSWNGSFNGFRIDELEVSQLPSTDQNPRGFVEKRSFHAQGRFFSAGGHGGRDRG